MEGFDKILIQTAIAKTLVVGSRTALLDICRSKTGMHIAALWALRCAEDVRHLLRDKRSTAALNAARQRIQGSVAADIKKATRAAYDAADDVYRSSHTSHTDHDPAYEAAYEAACAAADAAHVTYIVADFTSFGELYVANITAYKAADVADVADSVAASVSIALQKSSDISIEEAFEKQREYLIEILHQHLGD